jgi:hypothetical protein
MKKDFSCGASFTDNSGTVYCELAAGHCKAPSMKHRFEGISWTQAGADRVAREIAQEKAKQKSEQKRKSPESGEKYLVD